MKTAVITGATSGIGLETTKELLALGYKVYGLGRDFSKVNLENENLIKITVDLMDSDKVVNIIKEIDKNNEVNVLINNAGIAYFGLHEELNPKKIQEITRINLETPLVLCQLLMRNLKRNHGYIINMSSITAKISSTHGCAYGASKAGLTHFTESLFDECRKYGVKVIAIHPDLTATDFYRNADFETGEAYNQHLTAMEVAQCVKTVLTQRDGMVITDITVRPQINKIKRK